MGPKRMAIYKTRQFARFARKAGINDEDLWRAISQAEQGLIDADLGGGVVKLRVARTGEGKSGGSRSIVLFRLRKLAVYVYGFEKKDRGNIRADELDVFRELARVILKYSDGEIAQRVADGVLVEIRPPGEE